MRENRHDLFEPPFRSNNELMATSPSVDLGAVMLREGRSFERAFFNKQDININIYISRVSKGGSVKSSIRWVFLIILRILFILGWASDQQRCLQRGWLARR